MAKIANLIILSADTNVEQVELSYVAHRNARFCCHFGIESGSFF